MNQENKWGKIAVGQRIGSFVDPAFHESMIALVMAGLHKGDRVLGAVVGLPHAPACNEVLKRFLATDADSLLFLDDDMNFEYNTLNILRAQGDDYGILSALYCLRRHPFAPIIIKNTDTESVNPTVIPSTGIIDSAVVGLGFCLIRREVITKMMESLKTQQTFEWSNLRGEDGLFCDRAKALGYKIGVCVDAIAGHRTTLTARWDVQGNKAVISSDDFGLIRE